MRKSVIKYRELLIWCTIIGISLIIIGLLFFMGINKIDYRYGGYLPQPPSKSLYGITPYDFYAIGLYLLLIGLLLVFPTFNKDKRASLKNKNLLYLVITVNGLEIILYSFLINVNILPVLDPDHNWFGYFLIGFFVFFIGYMFVIFSMDDFSRLDNYQILWLSLVSFGVLMIIISLFTYWGLMRLLTFSPNIWPTFLVFGILAIIIGGPPLLINRITNNKSLAGPFLWIPILITGIGVITYLAPTMALNGILFPMTIFQYNNYYDYLIFGTVLILLGFPFILFSDKSKVRFVKERPVFITILVLGIIHFFLSIVLLLTDTYLIDIGLKSVLPQMGYKTIILGMPSTVWYINGFILTMISLLGIHLLVLRETIKLDNKIETDIHADSN